MKRTKFKLHFVIIIKYTINTMWYVKSILHNKTYFTNYNKTINLGDLKALLKLVNKSLDGGADEKYE